MASQENQTKDYRAQRNDSEATGNAATPRVPVILPENFRGDHPARCLTRLRDAWAKVGELACEVDGLRAQLASVNDERAMDAANLRFSEDSLAHLRSENDDLAGANDLLRAERDKATNACQSLRARLDAPNAEVGRLTNELVCVQATAADLVRAVRGVADRARANGNVTVADDILAALKMPRSEAQKNAAAVADLPMPVPMPVKESAS